MEKHSFESFIIQCCKSKEWDLRKFLKKVLITAGFSIKEDDYRSCRGGKFNKVHNMLATRGKPRVCLVAHTDVCRDHVDDSPEVDPVIKIEKINDEMRSIIQDRNCNVQVGGDDRLGVAINIWIALNSGYDMGILLTTDEEVGLVSAEYLKFPELLDFDLLVQVDRGNHSNQLVNAIGGWQLCSEATTKRLLRIAEDIGIPRYSVNGMMTDVLAIKSNHMCQDAVNMTCGYHNSYGAEKDEYIDIQESKDTMKYVSDIVKYYYLNEDKNEKEEYIDFDMEEDIIPEPTSLKQIERDYDSRRTRSGNRGPSRGRSISDDLWDEAQYENDKDSDSDSKIYRGDWPNNSVF